jgi:cyanophycin synthetase
MHTSGPGTLMIIGGAEDKLRKRTILKEFVAASGGKDARIVVIPTASSLGDEVVEVYDALFGRLGAARVDAIRPETRADAHKPDLVEDRRVPRLPGPNIWSYEPAIHLVVDLGVLEEYPTSSAARASPSAWSSCCPGWTNTPARAGVGGFIERMQEGTWLGHVAEHVALQLQQEAGHDLRRGKTRMVKGRPASTTSSTATSTRRWAWRPGRWPCAWSTTSCRPRRTSTSPRSSSASCARRAGRLRAVDRGHPRGGRQPRHPVHPAQLRQPRPARAGGPRPADPRHDDLEDRGPGRRHRQRQGHDRPSCWHRPGCRCPSRSRALSARRAGGSPPDRLPRRRQAAGRQPRPGRLPQPAWTTRRCVRPSSSPRSSRAAATSSSSRSSPAGTTAASSSAARMQAIAERCPPTSSATAPTPSELVDLTNADPRRGVGHEKVLTKIKVDAAAEEVRPRAGLRPRSCRPVGDHGQARPDRQHVHRRHLDRPHLRRPPRQHRDRRGGSPDGRPRRRGIDFICPDIAAPVRETGGAICEVNAAPGFRMHTHPTVGVNPSSSPSRSSTCSSRRAPRLGCRSSPSPGPTARRPPRG